MGKTALATSIAHHASEYFHAEWQKDQSSKQKSVGFFSLEMSAEQLASRLLSGATGLASGKLRKGDLSSDEFAVLVKESNQLSQLPFHIDDTPALSIAALRSRARRLKRVHNMGLLVIDYLQLVRGSTPNPQGNRVQEVSEITMGLKAIAKELDIPVLALSQLSRAVEQRDDKKPQLSDLRESGSIEQDSDVVMFVFREEYYLMRMMPREDSPKFPEWQAEMEKVHGLAEVIVAKHRNGPIGNVALAFQADVTKFSDLARTDYVPRSYE
jgi:replicative DNA helicase